MTDQWNKQSNRETVKTLLAMGFIPTWLEELLTEGDRMKQKLKTIGSEVHFLEHTMPCGIKAEDIVKRIRELLDDG